MNSNEQIKAPISLKDDVYYVLGISPSGAYYDLAEACASDKINKWSKYKPMVPYTDKPEPLTEEDIQSALCGLSPAALTYLRSSHDDYYPQEVHTKAEILSQVKEWEFVRKPMLGKNNWFRLTDFGNASEPGKYGYNHKAKPSDKDWESYSIQKAKLDKMLEKTITITRTNNSPTDFTVTPADGAEFYLMNRFSILIDTVTGQHIGNGDPNMLPLVAAAGGGFIEDEDWRIAYAVCIPYDGVETDATNEWYLFISRKPLKHGADSNFAGEWFVPDMITNTRAINLMLANLSESANQERITFDMIPCLVKNAKIKLDSFTQDVLLSHVYLESDAMIYAMPSGASSLQLTITKEQEEGRPHIDGVNAVAYYGEYDDAHTWILGTITVDEIADVGNVPVQAMVVVHYPVEGTGNSEIPIKLNVKYQTYETGVDDYEQIPYKGAPSGEIEEFTVGWNETFVLPDKMGNSRTFYGKIIVDPTLGLTFQADDVNYFTVGV